MERLDGKLVCKAVKNGVLYSKSQTLIAPTQRIDEAYLSVFDDFAPVPMIYQREIEKIYDIRVTVVGEQIFATAIHSQAHKETEVDWRVWDVVDFDLEHEAITLPSSVAQCCRFMTEQYGLRYSAIDLIYGTDGNHYFLEMNPNGQWAWIEHRTGYPIREAIARCMGYSQ